MTAVEAVIVLILHISTGKGHQDLHIEREMPTIQMCTEEATRFLERDPPEYVDGRVMFATCKKRIGGDTPT